MESAFSTPLILARDREPELLERVPLQESGRGGYDEAWLQDLLFRCPASLPIGEIDGAFSGCVPVCRELRTDAGYADLVYVTPAGRVVVVETKLWRNPEARRSVVGQILDYAQELARWTYTDLAREVARATGRHGDALFDIVSAVAPGIDRATFTDSVSRSLCTGRFLLLVVGDGIREGVEAIADFLQRFASLDFTFGLIEAAVYRHADGTVLVQPRILARSVVLSRHVVVAQGPVEITQEGDTDEGTGEAHVLRSFWEELLAGLRLDDADQPLPRPPRGYNLFLSMPPSGGVAWVSAYLAPAKGRCGVYLSFTAGKFADEAYQRLEAARGAIESEIGGALDWSAREGGKYMILHRMDCPAPLAADQRPAVHAFFRDWLNRFVNAFRPRLEALSRELGA
ncbi:MAG: DUF4268 domain-containing protein [Planctomycetes bacterium]|nr:DUF4268 domain-containing protein [Planctomycetota bacterium]